MYELKVISQFAAAHQLRGFEGGCEKLPGHNRKIQAYICGERLGKDGLLVDFKVVKAATRKALGGLDHEFLNELEPFKSVNPSSENIACLIFKILSGELNREGVRVSKVAAWESDSACATYLE